MAEGRMLKRAVSTSRRLADLKTDSARLLYTWIIPHLDIEGRFYADPAMIKGSVVPRLKSFTEEKIDECLLDMAAVGLIILYKVDGDSYLHLRKFENHQLLNPKREAPSKIPALDSKSRCLKKTTWERLWSEWEKSDKKCPVCGKQSLFLPGRGNVIDGHVKLHIDHIVPISKGGSNEDDNLRIICAKCNLSKGNSIENYSIDDGDSGQTPDELRMNSGQTPAEEKIREVKLSKEKPADAPFILPSKEEIQESSDPKIEECIQQVCARLYEEKIFPEVHAFKNKMLKGKKNGRGVLHVLTRCYLAKPEDPWAYCQKVIAVEDLNYNERDYRKTAQ